MTKWLAKQKFRFDYALSFVSTLNAIGSNVILMVVAEDKFKAWTGVKDMRVIIFIFSIAYILTIWAIGHALYKTKFMEAYYSSGNKVNDVLVRIEKYMEEHP